MEAQLLDLIIIYNQYKLLPLFITTPGTVSYLLACLHFYTLHQVQSQLVETADDFFLRSQSFTRAGSPL